MTRDSLRPYTVPLLIVVAASLAALVIYRVNGPIDTLASVVYASRTADAHVYGNPTAPTRIVEFADLECPYCAELHDTLKRIVDESAGTIAWEYRSFPLSIHPHATAAAYAAECVASLAGNDAFWSFSDAIFKKQYLLSSDTFLRDTAAEEHIASDTLATCMESTSTGDAVAADAATAIRLGGSGTPFSAIEQNGKVVRTVPGALPYAVWKQLLHAS